MNWLSWAIYLAELSGSLGVMLSLLAVALFFAAAVATMGALSNDMSSENKPTKGAAKRNFGAAAKLAIPMALVSAILPSSSTVYAIVSSEMGESALKGETGSKAVKALNAWLDKQITNQDQPVSP